MNKTFVSRYSHRAIAASLLVAGAVLAPKAQAQEEKFVYMTNWYAQAEHGGF
jgi:NitT/TauT family transport system substrate-binding protein